MKKLLLVRPVSPPAWWPTENDGWVSFDVKTGDGWMAGIHEPFAVPATKGIDYEAIFQVIYDMEEEKPGYWSWRFVSVGSASGGRVRRGGHVREA